MKFIAQIFSLLFHPLFIPTYLILILFYSETTPLSFIKADAYHYYPEDLKFRLIIIFLILTLMAPAISMIVFKTGNIIGSYQLDKKEDRPAPLMMVFFYYFILGMLLLIQDPNGFIPILVKVLITAMTLSTILNFILVRFIKLSLHASAVMIGVVLLFLYFNTQSQFNPYILPLSLISAGLIISSRWYLRAHDAKEIFGGLAIGGLSILVSFWFLS